MFNSKKATPQSRIDCLISADTVVEGNIIFNGGLRVDGVVLGNISVNEGKNGTLILSEHARVEGLVTVSHAVINGEIRGAIIANEYLQLEASARIDGDITYQMLGMHHGAAVSGKLNHLVDQNGQKNHQNDEFADE
ncbi:MAG: polymer-forming cytoskeletal protein [Burkholderiales bacterium]|jgi:cytoskeletal protein CcmA (bactofilin family)|nr:polymer-forming cytoskeletal protein [Burkholderiales bacterium]